MDETFYAKYVGSDLRNIRPGRITDPDELIYLELELKACVDAVDLKLDALRSPREEETLWLARESYLGALWAMHHRRRNVQRQLRVACLRAETAMLKAEAQLVAANIAAGKAAVRVVPTPPSTGESLLAKVRRDLNRVFVQAAQSVLGTYVLLRVWQTAREIIMDNTPPKVRGRAPLVLEGIDRVLGKLQASPAEYDGGGLAGPA